jgi:hypothetical protein
MTGLDSRRDRRNARIASHLAHVATLRVARQRHDDPAGAGTSGATGTVYERLGFGGRIDVHDQRDPVDVDAARGDVGGDQHTGRAGDERRQIALSGGLRQIAVQFDSGNAGGTKAGRQLLRPVLGACEQQRRPESGGQIGHDRVPLAFVHGEEMMRGGIVRCIDGVDGMRHRIVEVPIDDAVDAVVERRREQQPL